MLCVRRALRPAAAALRPRRYGEMHDPLEHVTGREKREWLAHLAGDCDPFHILMIKRGPSTRTCPTLIPSTQSKRMVGCRCSPGTNTINYMWLHDGTPKRCECGHWFELCPVAPL